MQKISFLPHLRKIRIVVSLFVFVAFLLVFLNVRPSILIEITDLLGRLQIIPSAMRFMAMFFAVSGLGFALMLLLTWLFGRIYCSSICPLGTLQDIFIAIARPFKKRKDRKFIYSGNQKYILRYTLLALTLILWFSGSLMLVNLLDPFSNFGRITVSLFKPAYHWLNNQLAFFLERFYIYTVDPIFTPSLSAEIVAVSSLVFISLVVMSVWRGRLFCNTICPAGSALSLAAHQQVFKITFNHDACTLCGKCERVCKAECLNSRTKTIDHNRCVSCFNCFAACSGNGLYYSTQKEIVKVAESAVPENTKRSQFMLTAIGGLLTLPLLKGSAKGQGMSLPGMVPTGTTLPIVPPGSISYEHFTSHCTACYMCVGVCPKNVIVPTFMDHGLQGIMQPKLDFHRSFCNFDCVECTLVCPSGAIKPQTLEQKQVIQLGIARFMVESCIVTVDRTDCGACSEHCPTKAVDMVEWDGLWLPEVTPDLCIGCGACEFACPTYPYKAIYVEANTVHNTAQAIPQSDGPRKEELEEFPF